MKQIVVVCFAWGLLRRFLEIYGGNIYIQFLTVFALYKFVLSGYKILACFSSRYTHLSLFSCIYVVKKTLELVEVLGIVREM